VVIDLVCFRRLGHNEQDEPFVTQPLMYKKIAQHPGTRKLYADKLEKEGVIPAGHGDELVTSVRSALDAGKGTNPKILYGLKSTLQIDWAPYMKVDWRQAAQTAVPMPRLKQLATRLTDIPANFKLHPSVERLLAARREMGEGRAPLDWGMAENLAYASLVDQGHPVRLSGQDAGRGTFAQLPEAGDGKREVKGDHDNAALDRVGCALLAIEARLPRRGHNCRIQPLGRGVAARKQLLHFHSGHGITHTMNKLTEIAVFLSLLMVPLTACTSRIDHHGYIAKPGAFGQISQGMTRAEVEGILGSPSTTASIAFEGDSNYYITSVTESRSFLRPRETNREVIAVRFDQDGRVTSFAQYGLEDGRIIDVNTRQTPVVGKQLSVLQDLFRGVLGSKPSF